MHLLHTLTTLLQLQTTQIISAAVDFLFFFFPFLLKMTVEMMIDVEMTGRIHAEACCCVGCNGGEWMTSE